MIKNSKEASPIHFPLAKIQAKSSFPPLLSMVLGANLLSADPTISYSQSGSTTPIPPQGFSWKSEGQTLSGFYQPLITETNNTLAEELRLKFDTLESTQQEQFTTTIKDKKITITADGTVKQGSNTTLTLATKDKGLAINEGKGTLAFDFAPTTNSEDWNHRENGILYARKMILNLSATNYQSQTTNSQRETSFVGNLNIYSGRAKTQFGENRFEATFKGDVVGNINITNEKYAHRDLQANLVFNENASIFGNIITRSGKFSLSEIEKNLFEFKGNNQQIKGSIFAIGSRNGFDFSNSGEKSIVGNISAEADAYENHARNTIAFNSSGTNAIIGNIMTTPYQQLGAINTIIFKAGNNTIEGNITAQWFGRGESINIIQAKTNSQSLTIIGTITTHAGKENRITLETGTNTLQNPDGTVIKADGGTNTVTFSGSGNSTITGDISANATSSKAKGANVITFNSSSTNTIAGNITATPFYEASGSNSITFTSGNNTITGNITAKWNGDGNAASNTITAKDASTRLVIDGMITAYAGKNTITLSAGDNELKNSKASISLLAAGGSNKVIATANLSILATILAKANSNTITSSATSNQFARIESTGGVNLLLLNGGGGGSNNFQGNISAYAGENIILIQSSNSTFGKDSQPIILTAKGSGVKEGKNIISISKSTAKSTFFLSDITLSNDNNTNSPNQSAQNILSLDGDVSLSIQTISTTIEGEKSNNHNQNIIAKNILIPQDGSQQTTILNPKLTIDDYFDDSHAFGGELKILAGISAIKGSNTLSFKASSSQSTNIISADTQGRAVVGGANIYLNIQDSALTDISKPIDANKSTAIFGDIFSLGSTPTNIKILGSKTKTQIGIMGAIITQSKAQTNIILQDALLTSALAQSPTNLQAQTNKTNYGYITNQGGTITLITRSTQAQQSNSPIFSIQNLGGVTNLIVCGSLEAGLDLHYTPSSTTSFVFANQSMGKDNFEKNSTQATKNQFLGKIYKDGVKITLQTKVQPPQKELFTSISIVQNQDNTINLKGTALGTIAPLADTSKSFRIIINKDSTFAGSVLLDNLASITLEQGSKLLIADKTLTTTKLVLGNTNSQAQNIDFTPSELKLSVWEQTNTIIDLATIRDTQNNASGFKLLRVGANGSQPAFSDNTGLQGQNALFRVYVNDKATQPPQPTRGEKTSSYTYADRIIVADIGSQTDTQQNAQTHHLQIVPSTQTNLKNIVFDSSKNSQGKGGVAIQGNIAVATVKNGKSITSNSTKATVQFSSQDSIQGFDQISAILTAQESDENGITGEGHTGWTTYFIDSISTQGISKEREKVSASALYASYDLFIIGINSLNKRMGELRENPYSQGVWGRIFGGVQSNDMGLGTKTSYISIQGGYDYAFALKEGDNYLGVALTYSQSSSKVKNSIIQPLNQALLGINHLQSYALEVGIYNAYIQDEGWYNDSIFKLGYITSRFNLLGQDTTYNTHNLAFTLSDEFGYRFRLGENQEWIIDPQMELSLSYFNQSDFTQKLGESWLDSTAKPLFLIRSRWGINFGYDFKLFTQDKPFKASIYLGAYYEYDGISGGDVFLQTNLDTKTTSPSPMSSNGRILCNLGTNIALKENIRLYFDIQKSFAGKIRADYQINVGARYSFGEKPRHIPRNESKTEITPPITTNDFE